MTTLNISPIRSSRTLGNKRAFVNSVPLQAVPRPKMHLKLAQERAVKPWILCIDDDEDFSSALKLRLQSQGYDVVRAFSSETGYRCAFELDPEAILLDLNMPNGSGEELLSQLHFHPETAHIPVMVVTGMNEPGLEKRLLDAGAHSFFRKPISHTSLIDAIQQARLEAVPKQANENPSA